MGGTPRTVEKIMALDLADFHRSLKALAPQLDLAEGQTDVSVPFDGEAVHIRFEAREIARLGGLLTLPRARVTLRFDGLDESARAAFLALFDRTFQRGGG